MKCTSVNAFLTCLKNVQPVDADKDLVKLLIHPQSLQHSNCISQQTIQTNRQFYWQHINICLPDNSSLALSFSPSLRLSKKQPRGKTDNEIII